MKKSMLDQNFKMPAAMWVAPSPTGKSFTCATIQLLGSARYFHEKISLGQMLQIAEMKADEGSKLVEAITFYLSNDDAFTIPKLAAFLIENFSIVPKEAEPVPALPSPQPQIIKE